MVYTDTIQGETPFKCYVCGRMMIVNIEGEYKVKLNCPRCKTKIVLDHMNGKTEVILETEKALPDTLVVKHGELVKL